MNFIAWLVVGVAVGAIGCIFTRTHDRHGILLNLVLGVAGAVVGGWLIWPEPASVGAKVSSGSVLVALVCAGLLVAIVDAVRRHRAR